MDVRDPTTDVVRHHLRWEFGWQTASSPPAEPFRPLAATYHQDGVLLVDAAGRSVVSCDRDGRVRRTFTRPSSEPLVSPTGACALTDGRLAVVDAGRCSLDVWDVDGSGWSWRLTDEPHHVEQVDDRRVLIVFDRQIIALDLATGAQECVLSPSQEFVGLRCARWLGEGHLLVADYLGHRVWEARNQRPVWTFGTLHRPDADHQSLLFPRWITRTPAGTVLIADAGNHRVLEVTADGEVVWSYGHAGEPGSQGRRLWLPHSVELQDGRILIASTANGVVLETTRAGGARIVVGRPRADLCLLDNPRSVAFGGHGRVLIADTKKNRVVEVDRAQKSIVWGLPGDNCAGFGTERLHWPRSAAYVAEGVVVADGRNNRVLVVDRRGRIRRELRHSSGLPLQDPHSVAVCGDLLAVTDTGTGRVLVLQLPDMTTVLDSLDLGVQLRDPHDACFEPGPAVVVSDTGGGRLVRIDIRARAVRTLGSVGKLAGPRGVDAEPGGRLVVAEAKADRLVVIDRATGLHTPVVTDSPLSAPRAVACGTNGVLLVADFGNNRVIELAPGERLADGVGG